MKLQKSLLHVILLVVTVLSPLIFSPLITTNKVHALSGYVSRTGTKFYMDGKQFKFVGFNLFDAAATDNYKCASWARFTDTELDDAIKYMKTNSGGTVLRFWAFQKYTNGATDFSGIDKVINIAKANDIKVMPVLENGQAHCTGGSQAKWQYNNDTWYTDGYKVPYGTDQLSFRDYAQIIVDRYKNEPAVLGWTMINEADTSKKNTQGKSVLVDFAADMGTLIKAIDTNHLLTVGTQSNGASGASGQDFIDVYSNSNIDFTEGHDWAYWGSETDPLPGSSDGITLPNPTSSFCLQTYQSKIACSIAQSMQILNKPFVMGESGMGATDSTTRTTRANRLDAKMNASFVNGVSGYLIWQFNKVVDTETLDVLSTTSDPLFAKMLPYSVVPLTNILVNTSFEGTNWQTPWIFEVKSSSAGGTVSKSTSTYKVGTSSARLNITRTNGTYWHIQFRQHNVSLVANTKYTISFWAKASNTRNIQTVIQKNYGSFSELSNITTSLNNTWKYVTYEFTPTVSDNNLLFTFNAGNALGQVWLDDVRISY